MNGLVFDTTKTGFSIVLKDWQQKALQVVWEPSGLIRGGRTKNKPQNSTKSPKEAIKTNITTTTAQK